MEKRIRPAAQNFGRILSGGMSSEDFIEILAETEIELNTLKLVPEDQARDFVKVCEEVGDNAYEYARQNEEKRNLTTASQYYFNASCVYRLGDYAIREMSDEKYRVYDKLLASFKKSKELSTTKKSYPVEIPFEDKKMPGYLLIPNGADNNVPVVIVIPGATGYKEENYNIAEAISDRGIAALIFDGPGQGDSLLNREMYLTKDNYDYAVESVIKFLENDTRVGNTIGIYGMSYGGYLAMSAAIHNKEYISAVVSRGGCSKTDQLTRHAWEGVEDFYLEHFLPKFNTTDLDLAKEISSSMNIEDKLHELHMPLLVVQDEIDPVLGTEGAKTNYNKVSSTDKEYYEVAGVGHCGQSEAEKTLSYSVDWISNRMKQA